MKHLFTHRQLPLLVSVTLAMVTLHALPAESHCPAGIASVTPRLVQHALIVIPIRINQKGSFDFIVDTGSQLTVVDPSLAVELALKPQGKVGLVSVASFAQAYAIVLDTLEADSKVVEKSPAVVQDLRQIQAADPRIRGVLGESFLAHFDMLVDYPHKLLCLDETSAMQDSVRGERIPFVRPRHPEDELSFMEQLRYIRPSLQDRKTADSVTTRFRQRRSHPVSRKHASGGPGTGPVSYSSRSKRYQCAKGLCRRAAAEHSDRQPHPEPRLIRGPFVHCQGPPHAA